MISHVQDLVKDYNPVRSHPSIYRRGLLFDPVVPNITRSNISRLSRSLGRNESEILQKSDKSVQDDNNFEEFLIGKVGPTLYHSFFGDYSRKWWGIEPKNLSVELAPKNLSIEEHASYGHISTDFTSTQEELYPLKGGIGTIARRLSDRFLKAGGILILKSDVIGMVVDSDKISSLIIMKDGDEQEIPCDRIISTFPLSTLCKFLNIPFELKYRADICVFMSVRTDRPLLDHSWIYFHDKDLLFGRIYEPSYVSKFNVPKGFSSLCAEITCFKDDRIWTDAFIPDIVLDQLNGTGFIKGGMASEVLGVTRVPNAYPLYTSDYREKLKTVFENVARYSNLAIYGRTGTFTYQNMDECIRFSLT